MNWKIIQIGRILIIAALISACTKDVGKLYKDPHNYPQPVAEIVINKCAVEGCHNSTSKDAAAGLDLESWDRLFEGSRTGAVVIPFREDFSQLLYYVNSYSEFGNIQLTPKMPLNQQPLSSGEVKVLFEWIKEGAPNSHGEIKFGNDLNRKKFYVANQGCDVVTVFDAKTLLAIRYISVGETRGIEAPHMVKVAPDNKHWYVSFIAGGYFQKYSTLDNSLVDKVNLGFGSWNTFAITSDSKTAYVIDWNSPGKIAVVDLSSMTFSLHLGFTYPHGSALKNDSVLYVTAQSGNFIYKINVNNFDQPTLITLDNTGVPVSIPGLDPHEIIFTPDGEKYFVTCQGSNEVRVMKSANDSLIAIINTGEFPQEMSISKSLPYLFVSCMNETYADPKQKSSIMVINYLTNSAVKTIYAGFQSHGVAVDDLNKRVYIGNRNILSSGPAPHHQGLCNGRNGYVTAIDLNTLTLINGFKAEVSIDPYSLGISH
jgi:DNA-binding beta-propeller fold protein YncE